MKKDKFLDIVKRNAKKDLDEKELAFFGSVGEAIESAFQENSVTRKNELENITTLLGSFDEGESAASVIRALAKQVDDLEKKTKRGLSAEEKYKLRNMLEDKKDDIVRARGSNNPWAIEFKAKRAASAMMTTSTILTGATAINTVNVMDDLDVLVIQYPKNFIVDAIGGRQIAKVPAVLRWKEQDDESDGAPAVVAEGGTKPLTDKSFVWKTAERKKYAGRIEFTEELAMDFDQLLLQIIDMFEEQVIRVWNAGIQTLLVAYCSAYTATEFDGVFVSPNTTQVIRAGKLWIENNLYDPDIVMIRPGDAALAKIAQNAQGDISYLPDNVAFDGLTPFVSTNVPEGKIIVGTSRTVKEQHSNFILRRGMYGEQFIENEETIIGEIFSLLKLPTISQKSWLILDIDTVKTALLKVEGV